MCIENSLQAAYQNNAEFHEFIFRLVALANLPAADMEEAFYELVGRARDIQGLSVREMHGLRNICRTFVRYWLPKPSQRLNNGGDRADWWD